MDVGAIEFFDLSFSLEDLNLGHRVDLQQNYKFTDFLREFVNPKDGAQPLCQPTFEFDEDNLAAGGNPGPITDDDDKDATATRELKKVILVAHSAGGWISRILVRVR